MKKLSNLLLIITLLVGFSSCVVTKKQRENFLAKHCERKDSISYVRKDSIVYKDSLIYIPKIVNTPIQIHNYKKYHKKSLISLIYDFVQFSTIK